MYFEQCLSTARAPVYKFTYSNESTHNWRGHQASPTVVGLKGRLPQKLQSKSTFSYEIVEIHSLFRHGFMIKQKSKE